MNKLEKMTLADRVVRETLRPHSLLAKVTSRPLADVRRSLMQAKRFVLDADMSGFLADLSWAPFRCNRQRQAVLLDSIRYSAKLPAPSTWIEWDGPAFRDRQIKMGARALDNAGELVPSSEVPDRWGFLLEEHPQNPNAIRFREYCSMGSMGDSIASPPHFYWAYSTTDDLLPWPADTHAGIVAHGLTHIHCKHIGVIYEGDIDKRWRSPLIIPHHHGYKGETNWWVAELSGVVRYVLSFLATLNDAPVTRTQVEPKASFFARGKHRKFLAHTELRLKLPHNADRAKAAARLIVAAKRRMHEVLPHWRVLPKLGQVLCEPGMHLWASIDDRHGICTQCTVPRTHVRAHTRGSGLQGVVSHSTYRVTH